MKELEAQGCGEGKAESRRTMPSENTPDCRGKPTAPTGKFYKDADIKIGARTWNGKQGLAQSRSLKRAVQKERQINCNSATDKF